MEGLIEGISNLTRLVGELNSLTTALQTWFGSLTLLALAVLCLITVVRFHIRPRSGRGS